MKYNIGKWHKFSNGFSHYTVGVGLFLDKKRTIYFASHFKDFTFLLLDAWSNDKTECHELKVLFQGKVLYCGFSYCLWDKVLCL